MAVLAILASPLWCVTRGTYCERRANRIRLFVFFLCSLGLCALVSGAMWGCGSMKEWSKEVWNYKVVRVRHQEMWTTHETRTETYTTGSGKNQRTHTRTVHYTEKHGPYWTAIDEYGDGHGIEPSTYEQWKRTWANEKKTGENEGSAAGFDRAVSGGIFECDWTQDFDRIFPWADIHTYKNKVRCSNSVLKYREPTEELAKKYPRPADSGNTSPVISYGRAFSGEEVELLRRTNAQLGRRYLVHPVLVVFGQDVSRGVVDDVLSAWQGPNKNELVTFVSLRGDEVVWCEVHSWMDNTTIHATVRDEMMAGGFSAKVYSDMLRKHVPKLWLKKDFRDFDYLKVEMHWGWKVGSLLVSLVGLVVVFLLVDRNVER